MNAVFTRKDRFMKRNTNKYVVLGDETLLILKNGYISRVSTVSLPLIKEYTWCREGTGYFMTRTSGKALKLHRVILEANGSGFVDHIDGDICNNTLGNLRLCSKQQNEFNTKMRSDNKTGYRGVCFHFRSQKYRATITYCGKQIHLGLFENPVEAAKVYNKNAIRLFGEFARLNKVV